MDLRTGGLIALKKVMPKIEKEGFPITAVREIKLLKRLHHSNIIRLLEVVYAKSKKTGEKGSVFMVFPFMKHDLVGTQDYRGNKFLMGEIKCIFHQLISGLKYMHMNGVIHRDLKLANLLIGEDGVLKIADFGLARASSVGVDQTNKVVTRWYRSPELLLGATRYDSCVDMWSAGTIFGELVNGKPLFPGESELHVLRYIFDLLGPPDISLLEQQYSSLMIPQVGRLRSSIEPCSFPKMPDSGLDILMAMLQYNTADRATAEEIEGHHFFTDHPIAFKPAQLKLCPAPRRELQVKDRTDWRDSCQKRPRKKI